MGQRRVKMKKKFISAILCAAMTMSLLAGCGSSAGDSSSASTDSTQAGETTEAADTSAAEETAQVSSDEPCEIYMFISSPEYADAIGELIDAYKEVAPNVTINYETTQNDYPTLLKAKLNSGEVPDIFSSTSGKEIDVYKEYSYDLAGQPLTETMSDAVAATMQSPADGSGCYGIAIKGNYFGIVYNKAIFEECGITEFPSTVSAMKDACEKISAAGYKPFTTGFNEWWVYKHVAQHFFDAAAANAGISAAELVSGFENGTAKISDYPELYNNFFDFIDLAVKYGDDKPLETALDGEESAFGTGKAAMVLGQGAWIEADVLSIDPDIQIGFNGYPVTEDASQCQVISGSDQSLHVNKDSAVLQQTLDFMNWCVTSEEGTKAMGEDMGFTIPFKTAEESTNVFVKQDQAYTESGLTPVSWNFTTMPSEEWKNGLGTALTSYAAGAGEWDDVVSAFVDGWATEKALSE